MIVFDLRCGHGHVFEAWFGSSGDFEDQKARSLLACPICGDADIAKAVMAPRLGSSVADDSPAPVANVAPPPEIKALLGALAKAQAKALEKSEWVGGRFAEEARAIHHGDTTDRPIHGQATPAEARALVEEGVSVMPLPLPVTPPDRCN